MRGKFEPNARCKKGRILAELTPQLQNPRSNSSLSRIFVLGNVAETFAPEMERAGGRDCRFRYRPLDRWKELVENIRIAADGEWTQREAW